MTKEEFIEICARLIEAHFPKGDSYERGKAVVLIADLMQELKEAGVVKDE